MTLVTAAALESLDEILGFVFDIAKAADPLGPQGFDAFVLQMLGSLKDAADPVEQAAVAAFVQKLQRQWGGLKPAERTKAIKEASDAYLGVSEELVSVVPDALFEKGKSLVVATKAAQAQTQKLHIAPVLTAPDEVAIAHITKSQALFIRDAAGKRVEGYSQVARGIVAKGLEEGLDRYAIGDRLAETLNKTSAARSNSYWRLIASTFVGRARSYSVLSGFQEAGISAFQFEAVLDEVTTDICRFMHGKVFQTAAALQRYADVAAADNPEDVVDLQPWASSGKTPEGDRAIFYKSGGQRHMIARVTTTGVGQSDAVGAYADALSPEQMQARGMSTPPLHGHCRSALVPVFGTTMRLPEPPPTPPREVPPPPPIVEPPEEPGPPPPGLPENIADLVRPLPSYRDYERPGAPAPKTPAQLQLEAWLAKLEALPTLQYQPQMVHAPIESAPIDPASGLPKMPFPKVHANTAAAAMKKPTTPVPVAALVAPWSNPSAVKAEVAAMLTHNVTSFKDGLVVKFEGKYYVASPKWYEKQAFIKSAVAAHIKGETHIEAHVIDLDAKLAQAAKPKKPKAPKAPPTPTLVNPPAPPPIAPAAATPLGTADNILHQQVGSAQGSNAGGFYVGKDGIKRYVKFYDDPTQAYSEHLANQVYRSLGFDAPHSELFEHNGKVAYSSRIIDGAKTIGDVGLTKERANKILDGFAADVLVGNWDAVGAAHDNVMQLPGGGILRVDNGGTFLFRAKAGKKPTDTLNDISEWKVFPSHKNPKYQQVFEAAGLSDADEMGERVAKQIDQLLALRDGAGGWTKLLDTHAAGMAPKDRDRILEMLEARSKLLVEKAAELRAARSAAPRRPAPGAARWTASQLLTTPPQKGLRAQDLPESDAVDKWARENRKGGPGKLASGESVQTYKRRTRQMLDKSISGESRSAISRFTGNAYTAIRESEEEGRPNADAKAIAKAFAVATPEPGTVFRGIHVTSYKVRDPAERAEMLREFLENAEWGFGKHGVGATSSSTRTLNVARDSFMHGTNEPAPGDFKIFFKINGKSQIPIESISRCEHEDELLFGAHARMRTTGIARVEGRERVFIIECEEITDSPAGPPKP